MNGTKLALPNYAWVIVNKSASGSSEKASAGALVGTLANIAKTELGNRPDTLGAITFDVVFGKTK